MRRGLLLIAMGCGSTAAVTRSTPAAESPAARPDVAAAPGSPGACALAVDGTGFSVDGQRVDAAFPPDAGPAVTTRALPGGATLVVGADGREVWRVDCARTPAVARLVSSPDAEAASGELTADGAEFVFTQARDIVALDVVAGTTRVVYSTPARPIDDWIACMSVVVKPGQAEDRSLIDGFVGFADGDATLVVHRTGGHCHWPAMFEVRVTDWRDPARLAEHVARPIYDVVADRTGAIWMVDGGGLWRSRDRGDHWTAVPVRVARVGEWGAGYPVRILVDAKRPARLAVLTSVADSIAEGSRLTEFAGFVLRSNDGGKTWRALALPDDHVATWIASADGDVDHLSVGLYNAMNGDDAGVEPAEGADPGDGEREPASFDAAREREALHTVDGGKHWTTVRAATATGLRVLDVHGDRFEATNDGLVRTRDGVRTRVSAPIAKPFGADLF